MTWDARFNMPFLLNVNGTQHQVEAELDTPLVWILREEPGLTGMKFGCSIGICFLVFGQAGAGKESSASPGTSSTRERCGPDDFHHR